MNHLGLPTNIFTSSRLRGRRIWGLRDVAKYWPERVPNVPWSDIELSDCREANKGEVELYRDTQVHGRAYRQIGMHVVGQYDRALSLGLVCLRCERHGDTLIPLTLSIPETPAVVLNPVQRNPQRHPYRHDADWWREEGA